MGSDLPRNELGVQCAKVPMVSMNHDMWKRVCIWLLSGCWLCCEAALAIEETPWTKGAGFRSRPLQVPVTSGPGLTLLSGETTGIQFTNVLRPEAAAGNHNLLNGSGVALGDYDGDGWCDIFFANLNGQSALFRNLGGWRFEDVTESAGILCSNRLARGAVFADVDGNGRLDLLVSYCGQGVRLYRNLGDGRFAEELLTSPVRDPGSTSLALADVDGDGHLDLYVGNYGENTIRSGMSITTRMVRGREQVVGRFRQRVRIIEGHLVEFGEPDVLYLNDGRGGFEPVSWTGGRFLNERGEVLADVPWDHTLSVALRDINQNGHPDLYVCNDFQTPDRLWINDGTGRFRAAPREALRSVSYSSMAVGFSDIDRNGRLDFLVTDMLSRHHNLRMRQLRLLTPPAEHTLEEELDRPQIARNTLFWNRGDGTYAEIANFAGLAASDWSWTAVFLDVDLDGYEDVLIGTGHWHDVQDLDGIEAVRQLTARERRDGQLLLSMFPSLRVPNYAFRNRGDRTFEELGPEWGFDSLEVSTGMALGDLDNDGDLDVVINALNGPALIYRNEASAPRVAVRLRGRAPNTQGIGAKIRLLNGAVPLQTAEITVGDRYQSSDDTLRTFAAGTRTNRMTLEVRWRNGARSTVAGVKADHLYEIMEPVEPGPAVAMQAPPAAAQMWFEEVSRLLDHRHQESAHDDFAAQPLLPRRLTRSGPGVAWIDLDGSGLDDLVVGASRGGQLAVFRNRGAHGFEQWPGSWSKALAGEATGLVGFAGADGTRTLLVGHAHHESRGGGSPGVLRFDTRGDEVRKAKALPGGASSTGPLALGDLTGDGHLELFVGGRAVPGRYPLAASSRLFRFRDGEFELDAENSARLEGVGLVTGAVFADLDGNGRAELILACEWGPIRIFRHRDGGLEETTETWGLSEYLGLWSSISVADVDGDGRLDLVAGNWGRNSAYEIAPDGPWYLYYGSVMGDPQVRLLEGHWDMELERVVPFRDLTTQSLDFPWLRDRFPTHLAYAAADVAEVLGPHASAFQRLEVNTLESVVFLNRRTQFEPRPLPPEAQFSPVMGVAVGDLDGDGHEDLFLSQNFFAVRPEDHRLDAGRGLWLKGDGKGGFEAVCGMQSGIRVYGEQRGCAVADYDGDGRLDLVITQNDGDTRLYRNVGAKPGLRLRLVGPPTNPMGVGAVVQLTSESHPWPARLVGGGDGRYSQSGAIQVFGLPHPPAAVRVRWPGGKVQDVPLARVPRELWVGADGTVRKLD
jgi:enediyne biosynthesis protein E4